jgi:hypothetical protein
MVRVTHPKYATYGLLPWQFVRQNGGTILSPLSTRGPSATAVFESTYLIQKPNDASVTHFLPQVPMSSASLQHPTTPVCDLTAHIFNTSETPDRRGGCSDVYVGDLLNLSALNGSCKVNICVHVICNVCLPPNSIS